MATQVTGAAGGVSIPAGLLGNLTLNLITVHTWTFTLEHDTFDSTAFGVATTTLGAGDNMKSKAYGMYHATGTLEGWMDDGAMPSAEPGRTVSVASTGQVADFKLYTLAHTTAVTRNGYHFAAVITNADMSVAQSGQATLSLSYESSGPVTIMADT